MMARFRHRTSDELVAATRLRSPKQVETKNKGWITAGVGNWEVHTYTAGIKPTILEDPEFRETYRPDDADGEKALAAPDPGTLGPQHNHVQPAAPAHSKMQNLPPVKSAREAADEQRRKDEAAAAEAAAADAAAAAEAAAAAAAEAPVVDEEAEVSEDGDVTVEEPAPGADGSEIDPLTGE
jgi:hypothetical protein